MVNLRSSSGQIKCAPGNKPCGKRCIPKRFKCHLQGEGNEERTKSNSDRLPKSNSSKDYTNLMKRDKARGGWHPGVKTFVVVSGVTLATVGALTITGIATSQGSQVLEGGLTLDELKPGDVVRKPCILKGAMVSHYAVYSGKTDENGAHIFFEVSGSKKLDNRDLDVVEMRERPVTQEEFYKWERVAPPPGVYKQFGDSAEEYEAKYKEMVKKVTDLADEGIQVDYGLMGVSCETFANALAYGVPFSVQADAMNIVARNVVDTLLPYAATRRGDRKVYFESLGMEVPKPTLFGGLDEKVREAQRAMKIVEEKTGIPPSRRTMKGVFQSLLYDTVQMENFTRGATRIGRSIANVTAQTAVAPNLRQVLGLSEGGKNTKVDVNKYEGATKHFAEFYNWLQEKGFLIDEW